MTANRANVACNIIYLCCFSAVLMLTSRLRNISIGFSDLGKYNSLLTDSPDVMTFYNNSGEKEKNNVNSHLYFPVSLYNMSTRERKHVISLLLFLSCHFSLSISFHLTGVKK